MKTIHPSPMLKTALLADGATGAASAVLQLAFPTALAELLQLPRGLLVETGLFLVGFAALLLVLARSPRVPALLVIAIVVGNAGWAMGCLGLWAGQVVTPSAWGLAYLLMNAAAVLVFAGWEWAGLKASRPAVPATAMAAR